ncbi:MAG TPA: copper resistance protein CopC [Acidobacteriaceae bacterium]
MARITVPVFLGLILAAAGTPVLAQGCAQCLDATQATPPQVQSAYRHGIYLLGGAGAAFFIAGVLLLRRNP